MILEKLNKQHNYRSCNLNNAHLKKKIKKNRRKN